MGCCRNGFLGQPIGIENRQEIAEHYDTNRDPNSWACVLKQVEVRRRRRLEEILDVLCAFAECTFRSSSTNSAGEVEKEEGEAEG